MTIPNLSLPAGVGVGLHACHYAYIEANRPAVPWVEIWADQHLYAGQLALAQLDSLSSLYPLTLHSTGMSIGSADALNIEYLRKLKSIIERVKPTMISDHLAWNAFAGQYFHTLLPLPYTDEVVHHVAERIRQIQDFLGMRIAIENIDNHLFYQNSTLPEWQFLMAIAEESDCNILLNLHSLYTNAQYAQFDPHHYLLSIPPGRIQQIHLSDTSVNTILPPVWDLYAYALEIIGQVPTSIDWYDNRNDFAIIQQERELAADYLEKYAVVI